MKNSQLEKKPRSFMLDITCRLWLDWRLRLSRIHIHSMRMYRVFRPIKIDVNGSIYALVFLFDLCLNSIRSNGVSPSLGPRVGQVDVCVTKYRALNRNETICEHWALCHLNDGCTVMTESCRLWLLKWPRIGNCGGPHLNANGKFNDVICCGFVVGSFVGHLLYWLARLGLWIVAQCVHCISW